MDRAILGDQNGRENLVNFFIKLTILLPHGGGVFSNFPWCKVATISTALIATLLLPANDLFHAARWFVLRALCLLVGR